MIVGVISDTHDKVDAIDKAFEFFVSSGVTHIIHCGDWKSIDSLGYFVINAAAVNVPVKAVLGNNDHDIDAMITIAKNATAFELQEGILEFILDGKSCALYHGHHTPTLRKVIMNKKYDILFLGHTHKPLIHKTEHNVTINPGSVAFSIPRSKNFVPTVALLDTKTMRAEIHELTTK